jgi:hypothetical protein
VGVFPSPVKGNTFSSSNVAFSGFIECRTMDKVHKSSDSEIECNACTSDLLWPPYSQ